MRKCSLAYERRMQEVQALEAAIDAIRIDAEGDRYPEWVGPALERLLKRAEAHIGRKGWRFDHA